MPDPPQPPPDKKTRRNRWGEAAPAPTPAASDSTIPKDPSATTSFTAPGIKSELNPQQPNLATYPTVIQPSTHPPPLVQSAAATLLAQQSNPTVKSALLNDPTVQYFLSVPGGIGMIQQHKQHILPLSDDYLASILPTTGYHSVPPPKNYIPPTKTQSNLFILNPHAKPSHFSQKLQSQADSDPLHSSTGFAMPAHRDHIGLPTTGEMGDGDTTLQVLQHGVLTDNIPDELHGVHFSRTDFLIFNDLFSGKCTDKAQNEAYIAILKIKNASGRERKSAIRHILRDNGKTLKIAHYVLPVLAYLQYGVEHNEENDYERHVLYSFLGRLIPIFRAQFTPYVPQFIYITRSLLVHKDYYVRNEGTSFLQMLTRVVGLSPILKVILNDVNSQDDLIRDVVARTFACVTAIVGIKAVLPFLDALLKNTSNTYTVDTGLRSIQRIAIETKSGLTPYMEQIITLILPVFEKNESRLVVTALHSITRVCLATAPYICPSLDEVAKVLLAIAPKCKGRTLTALVQCITSFLPSLPAEHSRSFWQNVEGYVTQCCTLGDSNSLVIGVKALSAAIQCEAIPPQGITDYLIPFIKSQLLDPRYCVDDTNVQVIKQLCITISLQIGLKSIYDLLIPFLNHESPFLSTTAATIISGIATELGLQTLSPESEKTLIDQLLQLLQRDISEGDPSPVRKNHEPDITQNSSHIPAYVLNTIDKTGSWTTHPTITSLSLILIALGPKRAERYVFKIIGFAKWIISHKHHIYRYHAGVLITRAIAHLTTANEENKKVLRDCIALLYENLSESQPLALSSFLNATRATIQTMKQLHFWQLNPADGDQTYSKTLVGSTSDIDLTPSPTDLLTRLLPIIQNRHEAVALTLIRCLCIVGNCWGTITPSTEWVRIITQYLTSLLAFNHRCIRKNAVILVGVCAQAVGSVDVVLKLLPHLQHPVRTVRVGITSSVARVAETCGVPMVLPLLFYQYQIADVKTCTALLKCIVVCVQHCFHDIAILPTALYPMLTHILTSKHSKIIRVGLHISASLMMNCVLSGNNEIGKKLSESIGSYLSPLRATNYNINSWWWEWRRVAMGLSSSLSGYFARSLYTGLFHSARRVRENHWVWYNQLLTVKQHTMPMHYTKITTSDQLVQNEPLVGDFKPIESVTEDDIANNQYYDPYIFHPLSLPF